MERECNNWVKQIKAACPHCLEVGYYDEFIDKMKGIKGEVIECNHCHKKFKLG